MSQSQLVSKRDACRAVAIQSLERWIETGSELKAEMQILWQDVDRLFPPWSPPRCTDLHEGEECETQRTFEEERFAQAQRVLDGFHDRAHSRHIMTQLAIKCEMILDEVESNIRKMLLEHVRISVKQVQVQQDSIRSVLEAVCNLTANLSRIYDLCFSTDPGPLLEEHVHQMATAITEMLCVGRDATGSLEHELMLAGARLAQVRDVDKTALWGQWQDARKALGRARRELLLADKDLGIAMLAEDEEEEVEEEEQERDMQTEVHEAKMRHAEARTQARECESRLACLREQLWCVQQTSAPEIMSDLEKDCADEVYQALRELRIVDRAKISRLWRRERQLEFFDDRQEWLGTGRHELIMACHEGDKRMLKQFRLTKAFSFRALIREVQLLIRFGDHPNIVPLLGFFVEKRCAYLEFEFYPMDLATWAKVGFHGCNIRKPVLSRGYEKKKLLTF